MNIKVNRLRVLPILLALLVLLSALLCAGAAAIAPFAPPEKSTLTVRAHYSEKALENVSFTLYRVADRSDYSVFAPTEAFKDCVTAEALNDLDKSQWDALALTLKGQAQSKNKEPVGTVKTDDKGDALFSELQPGLYLVVGKRLENGGYYYDSDPFLIALPDADLEKGAWVFDATAQPKISRTSVPSGDDTISRKALKVWDDAGKEDQRPEQVAVQLLRDGVVYDTKTLNAKNNWRYTWNGLSPYREWTIVEQDFEGYTSLTTRSGMTYTITNTPREEEPAAPEVTQPPEPTPPAQQGPTLPQTGQLWWPVLPLAAAGLLLIVIGLLRRKGTSR